MSSPKQRGRTVLPSAPVSTLSVLAASLAALVAVSTGPATAASGSRDALVVRPTQALAVLLSSQTARSAPNEHSAALQQVSAQRPITNERTVLPVVGQRSGPGGVGWLQVLLPGRPNGHTGWIKRRATRTALTHWHIVIDTTRRRVTAYRNGRPLRVFKAVVGKPSTPTPSGKFFVEESVELGRGAVGAPFALALSARSNVFQEFEGGPGQIALHGLANVGGVPGTAVSHGCVRLDNDAMHWLVLHTGPGVPVTITG
jgi:lipoprotein-anchoring transpeptidase ErfK/SrfK